MPDKDVESRLRLANRALEGRITLLEKKHREQERGDGALQDSEKRYRRLFESAKDGILILDANSGQVVDANPFLLQLLGYSYDELIGQHIWEIGTFRDIAASKDAFKELQDNEYIRYDDLPLETHDGRRIAVEFVSNVYLVDHSKVIQCNIRDITARKGIEKALGESEAKMRNILDNIGTGVALISPRMEVLELNRRMREWFPGVDPSQKAICYRSFNDPPRDAACEYCPTRETLRDGLVHEGTTQTPFPKGIRNYRIISSPIFNASGEVTAAIEMVEDITDKLSLESQFRQAQKMEAVGLLAGGVAHDYNNMLTVIIGYAELALGKLEPGHPMRADLEEILKAAKRSTEITRQLLAFARKQTIDPKVIDMSEIVGGVLKMIRRLIGEDIDLAWLPGPGLWPVKMDPAQIDQILANLCVNARDAIAGVGKVAIATHNVTVDEEYCADHATFIPGEFVLVAVSDDGCGMDKAILDHIFDPFFTTKGVNKGTGLGLATVYGIVKQNNGFINVYSELGKGTTFKVYLPRHVGSAAENREESAPEIPEGRGETVLLVEDELTIMRMAEMMLERLGYEVLSAVTPREAMRLAHEHEGGIHLLVTDVVMPEMNGRELADHLHALYPDIKVLFMSGYTADVIAHRGVLDGGVNFLQKPFSLKDLAVKVRETLKEKRSNQRTAARPAASGRINWE